LQGKVAIGLVLVKSSSMGAEDFWESASWWF
jgi:hypothetical protein